MAGATRALFGSFLLLAGCSANVSPSPSLESDADATPATTAVVTFERVSSGDATRTSAVARFVQARSQGGFAIDERALRLVGAAFELPPSVGCVALADEVDGPQARAVELADVGAVNVLSPSGSFALAPRQVPDPVGLVGGVLYYAPSAAADVTPGQRYAVRGAGSTDLPAFEMIGNAPLEIAEVRVGGQTAQTGQAGQPRLTIAPPVDVTWALAADDVAHDADAFFVDVTTARGTMRCAADAASYSASLPAAAFVADEGTIAVHRVHRDRTRAKQTGQAGIESSEIRFDFSRAVAFTRH
jgi:hypothetical protein